MKRIFSSIIFILVQPTLAAVPKQSVLTMQALRLPLEQRLATVGKQGLSGQRELKKMAFNQKESLENRWRSITTLGRLYPIEGRPSLEKALKSPDWFMRNAALVVVPYNDRDWAIKWSRMLIHDPALVVRTAAVNTLKVMHAVEVQDLLWEKLYSSENYKSGESLWIRKHILETLEQFSTTGTEAQFVKVLSDKDRALHPIAMRTLEKLTKLKFQTADQWLAWGQNTTHKAIR